MKNERVIIRKMLFVAIIALTASCKLFAQGNSQNNGNGLWYSKGQDTVTTNRAVLINENLIVNKTITADSIHIRTIKIGNNSLWLGGIPQTGTDNIQSTNGIICFGNSGTPFSNIKVGIGTTTPGYKLDVEDNFINTFIRVKNTWNYAGGIILSGGGTGAKSVFIHSTGLSNNQGAGKLITRCDSVDIFTIDVRTGSTFGFVGIGQNFTNPKSQLHIHDGAFDTYTQITNTATGATANDGFRLGILATGEAILNQQENLPMYFNTHILPRMQIAANGFVGIGTPTPKAKLEVANGDIAVTAVGSGIILKANNGENFYRITVDNTGKINT